MLSYLNINSYRNKIEDIKSSIIDYVDVLCVSETKLDSSFPVSQFLIPGFKQPYRMDVSQNSGGLLIYVRNHIPAKELPCPALPNDIQCLAFEIVLRNRKWLNF